MKGGVEECNLIDVDGPGAGVFCLWCGHAVLRSKGRRETRTSNLLDHYGPDAHDNQFTAATRDNMEDTRQAGKSSSVNDTTSTLHSELHWKVVHCQRHFINPPF